MADTAIPFTDLTPGASVASPAGTAIVAANTHTITLDDKTTPGDVIVRITNTTASQKVATVTAGDSPPLMPGEPAAVTVTLAAGDSTPTVAYVLLSSKQMQDVGTIVITVAASMTGNIAALRTLRV